MKTITSLGVLIAAVILMSPAVDAADINLMFDGVTDGGWTLTDSPAPTPSTDIHGTGLPGISFDDTVAGYAYYYAPASLFNGVDLTGSTLNFNFWIEDYTATSTLADEAVAMIADLRINGTFIYGLDVIDEGQLNTLQSVTIDFTDPAFAAVDLTNVTMLGIRAEYWKNGMEGVESHLVSVPEPAAFSLAALSLCGLMFRRRRK